MPAKAAAARTGAARRSMKGKTADVEQTPPEPKLPAPSAEAEDWVEADDSREHLEEGEMEILLTGHAATHGIEGEDNWLIETDEVSRGER
jgi:hypothetical protein